MSEPFKITTGRNASDNSFFAHVSIQETAERYVLDGIVRRIVELVAERYVNEKFPEIAAKLDQNAIANLAIADAAKKIAEEIRLRPEVTKQVETQVFQRGIFGGIRRAV